MSARTASGQPPNAGSPMPSSDSYSVVQAAPLLGVSVFRVRMLVRDGTLFSELRGGRRLIPAPAIAKFHKDRLRKAAEANRNAPSDWDWEGNVVSALVDHFEGEGWQVLSRADPATREHGVDLVIRRGGQTRWIEAKGWPAATHARGEKKGQPKLWRPTMARTWFGDLVLQALLLRADHPADPVAIALPAHKTYTTLLARIRHSLEGARIGAYVVYDDRDVDELIPAERGPSSATDYVADGA